jgi:hypothetical protein
MKNFLLQVCILFLMTSCNNEAPVTPEKQAKNEVSVIPEQANNTASVVLEKKTNYMINMSSRAKTTSESSAYYNKFFIGYYGRPNAEHMGILGMHKPEDLVQKLLEHTKIYQDLVGKDISVVPVFHLIYGMASTSPQKDGSYLIFLNDETVMKYIEIANKAGFAVILDIQIGNKIPVDSIQKALPFLKYKDVHLAIDPEFSVTHLKDIKPGKFVGYITAQQINDVQKAMVDYMIANNITDNKILIVHSFKHKMIKNQYDLAIFDKIDLTINVDGYSNPCVKIDVFDSIITQNIDNKAFVGFKLFLDPSKDRPLMTPRQSLGLDSYKTATLKVMPSYINMQ